MMAMAIMCSGMRLACSLRAVAGILDLDNERVVSSRSCGAVAKTGSSKTSLHLAGLGFWPCLPA